MFKSIKWPEVKVVSSRLEVVDDATRRLASREAEWCVGCVAELQARGGHSVKEYKPKTNFLDKGGW